MAPDGSEVPADRARAARVTATIGAPEAPAFAGPAGTAGPAGPEAAPDSAAPACPAAAPDSAVPDSAARESAVVTTTSAPVTAPGGERTTVAPVRHTARAQ